MTNLTAYETKALNLIVTGCSDHYNENDLSDLKESIVCGVYCSVEVEDIAKACEITVNQAKGVLGSLTKKDLVDIVVDYDYINPTAKGITEFEKMMGH